MARVALAFCFVVLSGWISATRAQATKPATQSAAHQSPEELLKSNGLIKSGTVYVLAEDAKLQESLQSLRQIKLRLDDNSHRRALLLLDIATAEKSIAESEANILSMDQRLAKEKDPRRHNDLVFSRDISLGKMSDAERTIAQRQKSLQALEDPADDYISLVLSVSAQAEAIMQRYEALAKDALIIAALEAIAKQASDKSVMKLGPSAAFVQALPFIRKQREAVNAASIRFKMDSGVPTVEVALNGKIHRSMTFDSGASAVSLSWDTAKEAGMTPGAHDPVIKLTIADGSVVEARGMTIKSVRLGQFTVENVMCSVLPKGVVAPDLLGGTFLRNFTVRLDLASQELHLTPIAVMPPDHNTNRAPNVEGPVVDTRPGAPVAHDATPHHTDAAGGTTGKDFEQLAGDGGFLVGIRCSVGSWAGHKVITSVAPVFASGTEKSLGTICGQKTKNEVSAEAKAGYAVGGIVAKTGNRLDGFKVIFMRRKGDHLDPTDSYESDWIGGTGGGERRLGCDGKRVIGIFGRSGAQMDALGLVQAE